MKRKRFRALLAAVLLLLLWPGPASADGLSDLGTALDATQRGNDSRALRYYNRALWSGELPLQDQAVAFFLRALAQVRLSNHAEAVADYGRAIELEPGFAAAYYNRGVTQAARGKLSAALDDYGAAIRFDYPALYKPLFNRGEIYESRGDFERAVADFKSAYTLAPDIAPVRAKAEALGLDR